MYLDHFGLLEPPFRITPHTDFFFSGANRGATLEALLYAITHDEGIVKVTGEVGSGKTMLCRVLIERLPADVETVYLANPSLEREEILQAVFDDLKFTVPTEQKANQLLRTLQEHLIALYGAGKRVVLLIDEAHAMPPETLEQIRLLSNLESNRHKLLQIALFGQQELDDHLGTMLLRPLRERVTHSFRLEPLVHADVGQYLMFRMRQAGYKGPDLFDRNAIRLIAKSSEGLTRRLNILADKCLLAAFSEGEHGITRKHAVAAINDSGFAPLGPRRTGLTAFVRWNWPMALSALALIAGGVIAGIKIASLGALQESTKTRFEPAGAVGQGSNVNSMRVAVPTAPAAPAIPIPITPQTAAPPPPAVPMPTVPSETSRPTAQHAAAAAMASKQEGGEPRTFAPAVAIPDASRPVTMPEPQFSGIANEGESRPVPMPKPRYSAVARPAPAPQPNRVLPRLSASSRALDVPVPIAQDLPPEVRPPSRDD